jgi:hypothetical protein
VRGVRCCGREVPPEKKNVLKKEQVPKQSYDFIQYSTLFEVINSSKIIVKPASLPPSEHDVSPSQRLAS